MSSGEALLGDYSLSEYQNVGTEANPIYCIKRVSNEKDPLNSNEKEGIKSLFDSKLIYRFLIENLDWKRDTEKLHNSPVKIALVNDYCEEYSQGITVADTLIRYCAKVVSEHQYLNHGWTAIARNLDENFKDTTARYARAYKIAQRLPQIRNHAKNWITNFDAVFDALSKIQIPGSLLTTSQISSSDSEPRSNSPIESISLLDWIQSRDPLHTIDSLIEHVSQYLEKVYFLMI